MWIIFHQHYIHTLFDFHPFDRHVFNHAREYLILPNDNNIEGKEKFHISLKYGLFELNREFSELRHY